MSEKWQNRACALQRPKNQKIKTENEKTYFLILCCSDNCSSIVRQLAVNVEEVSKGGIAGIVADKVTGEPVPTVKLKLSPGGNSTVTGSDGSFQFEELEAGEYTVTYTKDGYRDGMEKLLVKNTLKTDAHLLIERIPAIITADKELLDFGSNTSLTTLSFNI